MQTTPENLEKKKRNAADGKNKDVAERQLAKKQAEASAAGMGGDPGFRYADIIEAMQEVEGVRTVLSCSRCEKSTNSFWQQFMDC